MTVSERIPFSGLLLPPQKGYTYVFASFNSIMVGVLMVAIAVYVCVGLPNMNPGQLVLADMFSSGPKLTTLGAGIAVLVFVMLFAIVITSPGATFGVLMTLFSFANCLGDIVLCIIPFFLRKKYPHACRHAGFTMPLPPIPPSKSARPSAPPWTRASKKASYPYYPLYRAPRRIIRWGALLHQHIARCFSNLIMPDISSSSHPLFFMTCSSYASFVK